MIVFRVLGAFCLLGSGCALGWKTSMRLKRRLDSLEDMRGFLERLHASISYAAPPMEEIVREMAEDGTFFIASECLLRLRHGAPFPEAFAQTLRRNETALSLTREDTALLIRSVERLGRTDAQGQVALLKLGMSELEPRIASAAENVQRKGKLYRSLGVLGGLAGVVLFL